MRRPDVVLFVSVAILGALAMPGLSAPIHSPASEAAGTDNPNPPTETVKLIFIHHSTGENWLADEKGGLGLALRDNNYFVSDTNYGWGEACPNCGGCESDYIGSCTDIGHWWEWFRGPNSTTYMSTLYTEYEDHSYNYTRLADPDPDRENEIVMFKSCFPNSHLGGDPNDLPTAGPNPLRGQGSDSEYHTVGNAKGIYNDLLAYFATRQDKLFVVIAAPPLVAYATDPTYAANARAFNNWLVNDWLDGYPHNNVAVFDFYNVLTSNGGDPDTNDLGQTSGNHHRWWHGAVQHVQPVSNNYSAYGSDDWDSHPTRAGNEKATAEFVPLLNVFYHRWKSGVAPSLAIVTPNGGECWRIGSQQQIRWTTTGTVPQVSLAYSTDGFTTTHTIASPVANTGVYAWTTPLAPSKTVRVQVSSVVSPTTVYDVSDGDFTLYDPSTLTNTVHLPFVARVYALPIEGGELR